MEVRTRELLAFFNANPRIERPTADLQIFAIFLSSFRIDHIEHSCCYRFDTLHHTQFNYLKATLTIHYYVATIAIITSLSSDIDTTG
jgi:hypothetical protein